MSWLKKLLPAKIQSISEKKSIPEGLWIKCPECEAFLFNTELNRNLHVCPQCNYHWRVSARKRISMFLDPINQVEIGSNIEPRDILKFRDTKKYKDRLISSQKATSERDALVVVRGTLQGMPLVVAAFEFAFIGGSMGAVVGEKFVQAVETCLSFRIPLVCFSCSGGARMQESVISLMQMAKTSAALAQLRQASLPYISVMVDPCTGGVSASLAMLGDINIAEPKALIGFAGPKVIEQTVREVLPEGFQTSEFLLEKGFIDLIEHRKNLPIVIYRLLTKLLAYHS